MTEPEERRPAGEVLRAPFPWFGNVLQYAASLVHAGVLRIDEEGRIWRHAVVGRCQCRPIKPRRAENVNGNGYLRVTLQCPDGKTRSVMAQRVVWFVVHGTVPDRQINHLDLDRQNNAPSNLELTTQAENIKHSYANGRRKPWSEAHEWRPGRQRLSQETINQIRSHRRGGMALKAIAARFGISISHVHRLTSAPQGGGR